MVVYKKITSRRKGGLQWGNFKEKGWPIRLNSRRNGGSRKGVTLEIKGVVYNWVTFPLS